MIARHERRILEAHVRKVRVSQLDFLQERELNEYEKRELKELVKMRMKGIPLQYLINNQAFFGREFYVNPSVLIPRPETEGLVEQALKHLPPPQTAMAPSEKRKINILDFGTGSACIAITIALERQDSFVWASDASEEALAVATENARNHRAINIDLLKVSDPPALWQYEDLPLLDLLISNPPYLVPEDDISEEVRKSEPPEALFTPNPEDPCFYYRFLAELADLKIAPTGFGIFEIAEHRAEETAAIFNNKGFLSEVYNDLTERPRYLLIYREGQKPAAVQSFNPF